MYQATPPIGSFGIQFIGEPRDAHPIYRRESPRRRAAAIVAVAAAFFLAGMAFATASSPAVRPAVDTAPVRGEFRLAPGNQQPPAIVVPLTKGGGLTTPVRGEFRLAPGNQQPPGVIVPLD
jgi:hypothetical protein